MRILCLLVFCCALFACTHQNKKSLFTTDALPKQSFMIDPSKDTVIKTAGGALLRIEKESFSGAEGKVSLDVKEALTMQGIIKAGLTTTSNGNLLSSGGMLYVKASNEKIKLVKAIKVSLPATNYAVDMQLYKGEEKDGDINWIDPKPIRDSMPPSVAAGKRIFMANCATCHALDLDLVGPALRGVENRGPWNRRQNLFEFTRNPGAFLPLTNYTSCLAQERNGQIMPSFPQLSDEVLEAVYDYIKWSEGSASAEANPCDDSCRRYDSAVLVVNKQRLLRRLLIEDNGPMSQVYRDSSFLAGSVSRGQRPQPVQNDLVTMEDNRAEYYQFSINAFGWYNVDMLLKERDDLKESKLTVKLEGGMRQHVDIYLAIPSVKLFTKAGRTDIADEFAFNTKDGKLYLPQGDSAYIFAMSETADGILFAYRPFVIGLSQTINIEVTPSSKEAVYTLFQSLKMKDVSIAVNDSKNTAAIRKSDKEISALQTEADKLKPKSCQCFCTQPTLVKKGLFVKINPVNLNPKP